MANFGILAGGLSDTLNQGLQRNQQNNFQQQELKLQQQGQENAEKRFEMSRHDKLAEDLWSSIQQTVEQARIVGHNEKEVMPAVQGLVDQYRKFTTSIGYPGMADQKMAALWARPPQTETTAALAAAKEPPKVEKLTSASGDQTMYAVNARKGTATEIAGTGQASDMTGLEGDTLRDALAKRSGMTGDQLDMGASQLNEGNNAVLTNLGRGKQGGEAVKALRAWAAYKLIHQEGLSPQEAAERVNANTAEYTATKAGASTLARREAQVIGAATTAAQTAPRVLEASKSVDRTQYKSLNSLLLAWREGTGDENVIRLGIAVNTFVNNYARAVGAGSASLTDSARGEAMANLQKAWSSGQMDAAIDQMLNKELPSEITGAKMGLREFLSSKKKSGGSSAPATGKPSGEWTIERVQ